MTAANNAAGRTTAASLPCCLTSRRIKCVEEALVYVGFAARISVSRVAATGRSLPIAGVGSPVAQLGGLLSGGEIAHPAVASRPSGVGRVDGLDVGSAA